MTSASGGSHIFSVDVEEYFQVNAFDSVIDRGSWDGFPSRVDASVDRILHLLDETGAKGTFFILGWLARRRPHIVRTISDAGHEVASHGFWHRRVTTLSPEAFRDDVRQAKAILEDLSGRPVFGYRAPSFSILSGMEWAFEILLEEGHRYDSSRFPIRRPGYGSPGTPRWPHHIPCRAGDILELPMATARLGNITLPAAGGGYLRQLPYPLLRLGFAQAQAAGKPGMFYIHPWELDPDQPRIPVPPFTRIRHYRGLSRTEPLLERLLAEFRFASVATLFPELAGPTPSVEA